MKQGVLTERGRLNLLMHRGGNVENIMIDALNTNNKRIKMKLKEVLKHELAKMCICKYDIEVVKAITVLIRSELIKRIKSLPYSISYSKDLIINEGIVEALTQQESILIDKSIEETSGMIVISGNKAVDLYYTVNCGGGTANSENVIGYGINYLRKVLCRYCNASFNENIIKVGEIAQKLNILGIPNSEEIKGILTHVSRDETGRIINLCVMGNTMTGDEFAKLISAQSTRIYFQENSITFKSIGEGSGLGICLDGAENLAENGFKFEEIIKYYYTGVEFTHLDEVMILTTLKKKRILIDPGHGGSDCGNIVGNLVEKNINLIIALQLEKKLKNIGTEVILTRNCDVDMPTIDRVKFINDTRPEMFISIHQNSFMLQGVNGVEAYCYEKDEDALKIGRDIICSISEDLKTKNRGVRVGDYYLLRETKVSGLILECMYMTGNIDAKKYDDSNYDIIGNSIFKGICKFYGIEAI